MPTSLVHTIAVDHILLPQAFHNYFLRRFISMYGDVVLHIPNEEFERCINRLKKEKNVELDVDLSADDLQTLTTRYKVKWHTQSFVLCCRSINHRDAHDSSVCLTKNWVAVTAGSIGVTAGRQLSLQVAQVSLQVAHVSRQVAQLSLQVAQVSLQVVPQRNVRLELS